MHPATLQDIAYNYIRDGIMNGKWQPGERLREDFIAAEIGISRTPVREAINRLAAHGLLKNTRRIGVYVAELDETDVLELLDIRESLEHLAVTRLAEHDPPLDLDPLQLVHRQYTDAVAAGSRDSAMQYDREFHRQIISMTNNRRLESMYQEATASIHLTQVLNCLNLEDLLKAVAEHEAILQGLINRNPQAAREAVTRHFQRIRHSITQAGKESTAPLQSE